MTIKGLKVGQIMDMTYDDLKGLEMKELKVVASRLFSASNKRIKRLQASSSVVSPALANLRKTRGANIRFSRAGKSKSALISEITSARSFMEKRTSSVSGARAYMEETEERIGGEIKNPFMRKKFWKEYRKFSEANSNLIKSMEKGSTRVQKMIRELYVEQGERDWNSIFAEVENRLDESYREEQDRFDDMLGDYE